MARRQEKTTFDFADVMLVPNKCVVGSRSEVDTSVTLGKHTFKIPAVPANMSTIVDENLAEYLAENGYFYVMHRFDVDPIDFTATFRNKGLISSVSLGIKDVDYEHIENFVAVGLTPDYITVDVAHGHSDSVIKIVEEIKAKLPKAYLIAGNVGSVEGALALENAGADCIKVGIAPGCFAPGNLVVTKDQGLKAIEDIEVFDSVLTHGGRYQEVTNKFVYDHHEELITINGIRCTPEHEFYVCDKEDKEKITDENYQKFCYWVEAHELDKEKQFLINISE